MKRKILKLSFLFAAICVGTYGTVLCCAIGNVLPILFDT